MKTIIFKGKDEFDLNQQKWKWQSENPKSRVTKTYPIERLIPEFKKPTGKKLLASDSVSRRVDYED
jgi:hypothetical protein